MGFHQKIPSLAFCLVMMACVSVVVSQKLDILCLLEHCGVQMYDCVRNNTCRDALTCFSGCGTNMSCTMLCLYSYGYENQQFYKFFSCASDKHKCITVLPSTFNCSKPQNSAQNFTFNMLKGQWYNVRGKTLPMDCYACNSYFYVPNEDGTLSVTNFFDVKTLSGKSRRIRTELTEVPTTNPAVWKSTGSSVGVKGLVEVAEEWRAVSMATTGHTLLNYYCGNSMGYGYEGMMLFSRTQSISDQDYQAARAAALAHGYDLDKFCAPSHLHCLGA